MNNDLIDDDSSDESKQDLNHLFTSSESSTNSIKKDTIKKSVAIDSNLNPILNATTGMNNIKQDIDNTNSDNETKNVSENKDNIENDLNDNETVDFIDDNEDNNVYSRQTLTVKNMLQKRSTGINGWDENANVTITNWYNIFKQQSYLYQWVLDRNRKISDRLTIISILSSSILGMFSALKLWIDNDSLFQTISNIILMFLNFIVALVTATSKKYMDDKRNETLRTYVEQVDSFLGEISAQVLKSPIYRIDAHKFFKQSNKKYTNLISLAPNLSITELTEGKKKYKLYSSHINV